jgi:hypothetical protein
MWQLFEIGDCLLYELCHVRADGADLLFRFCDLAFETFESLLDRLSAVDSVACEA